MRLTDTSKCFNTSGARIPQIVGLSIPAPGVDPNKAALLKLLLLTSYSAARMYVHMCICMCLCISPDIYAWRDVCRRGQKFPSMFLNCRSARPCRNKIGNPSPRLGDFASPPYVADMPLRHTVKKYSCESLRVRGYENGADETNNVTKP